MKISPRDGSEKKRNLNRFLKELSQHEDINQQVKDMKIKVKLEKVHHSKPSRKP